MSMSQHSVLPPEGGSYINGSELPDRERALHVFALRVLREAAIEREGARPVGAELEGDALAGAGALDDAVLVDGEAVGDVARRERDLHQVVLVDGEARRREGVVVAGDGEFPDLSLVLGHSRHEQQDARGERCENRPLTSTHGHTLEPLDGPAAEMVASPSISAPCSIPASGLAVATRAAAALVAAALAALRRALRRRDQRLPAQTNLAGRVDIDHLDHHRVPFLQLVPHV